MDNRNSARLREIIAEADPDVILVVEADAWWQSELGGFGKTHPFSVRQAQDNTYGMLLYSKLELVRPEVRFLIEKDVPSIRPSSSWPREPKLKFTASIPGRRCLKKPRSPLRETPS
jgi:hypothetical protein